MKPIKLEFQAFGPYANRECVDFENLSAKGMFLIKGPTGSGKTTIFDAMTFALYGGSSGDGSKKNVGRNDLEEWRCNQAEHDTETYVSFTFSSHGHLYQFTRKLVPKRKLFSAQYGGGELVDGVLMPFFENPKKDELTKKAEELIGLTKDQFRQVVLLPQGQFERFLTADADDKEVILQKIFDAGKWKSYAEKFYQIASERKKALDEVKQSVQIALSEENVTTLQELSEKINVLDVQRTENLKERMKYVETKPQEHLNADIQLFEQFRPLHELRGNLEKLDMRADEFSRKRNRYTAAENAESLRQVISDYKNAVSIRNRRQSDLNQLNSKTEQFEKNKVLAEAAKKEHDSNSPISEIQQKIGVYSQKAGSYESIDALEIAFRDAERDQKIKLKALKTADVLLKQTTQKVISANALLVQADNKAALYRTRYLSGICGELAIQLTDGSKCPVCGSTDHPEPACISPESISREAMEKAQENADSARQLFIEADEERTKAQKNRDAAFEMASKAEGARVKAESDLNTAKHNLIPGINNKKELKTALAQLQHEISEYQAAGERLASVLENAEKNLNVHKANLATAVNELSDAELEYERINELLIPSLREKGYTEISAAEKDMMSAEQRSQLQSEIVSYARDLQTTRDRLSEKQHQLEGKTEPDSSSFTVRQKEINEKVSGFERTEASLKSDIDRLKKKQSALLNKCESFESQIQEAENDLAFARKLRGDTGIGLQRYVLAIMFGQIISEANRMLERVHGGRYHLFRTDEKSGGNKSGLGLKVHDNRSPEKEGRSVSMLSGGEKFLVSLALSIGMSTVAQKTGVQIEALFIDEGFGTLDESSINDAMDILESVHRSNGMIGIISHVQLLENTIPTHLEVIKKSSGSTIKVC